MKILIATAAAACAVVLSAKALDTTVSNDFWCTWNYANPKVATAAPVLATDFDDWCFVLGPTSPLNFFSSFPAKALILSFK